MSQPLNLGPASIHGARRTSRMPEPHAALSDQVDVAERAMLAALQPDAAWTCEGCGRPKDRPTPFTGADLREQVRHLPYSSSVVQLALYRLMERGVLIADTRWRLTVNLAAMGDEHQAPAGCCDGDGQVHHGSGALSYVTLCRNAECVARREAAWAAECGETPASGEERA
jgi:hypothetical protein